MELVGWINEKENKRPFAEKRLPKKEIKGILELHYKYN